MQDKLTLVIVVLFGIFILFEIGVSIVKFFKKPKNQQIKDLKEWLLYAVVEAEKKLGGGTGQIKLRYVYDMFIEKFKFLALMITFEQFSIMVDMALDKMRLMLSSNEKLKDYVEK